MKPRVGILKADGTNCDQETAYALEKVGFQTNIIPMNRLKTKKNFFAEFHLLVIPGGFSYGDDIASGKIFALELFHYLRQELEEFVKEGNLILGICNGFQVLVQMGLLPFNNFGNKHATLTYNASGKFECRWITMLIQDSPCIFTKNLAGTQVTLPVAHGEGNFFTDDANMTHLEQKHLAVLRYTKNGDATQEYPYNPSGSDHALAGVCDPSGRIFGLMPHPERYIEYYHAPNWRRGQIKKPHGLLFFEQAFQYLT